MVVGNIACNGLRHQRFNALLVANAVTNIRRAMRHGGHGQPMQGKFRVLDRVRAGDGADSFRACSYINYSESGQVSRSVPVMQALRLVLTDEQTELSARMLARNSSSVSTVKLGPLRSISRASTRASATSANASAHIAIRCGGCG